MLNFFQTYIKTSNKGVLTWQLRIWFSSTQIPNQWSLALRITLTLFFQIFAVDEAQIGKRTRDQTQIEAWSRPRKKSTGVVTSPVVALPSYPGGRSAKKCIGRNFCKMWSVNRLKWSDLTNAVEIKVKNNFTSVYIQENAHGLAHLPPCGHPLIKERRRRRGEKLREFPARPWWTKSANEIIGTFYANVQGIFLAVNHS